MFMTAKLRIIFQSSKLFRINMRIWRPLLTFYIVRNSLKKTGDSLKKFGELQKTN